jgi:hypothetical protein
MSKSLTPLTRRIPASKSALRRPESVAYPDAQRGYRHAIDEFVDWYCSEPRLSFSKTVVLRYRVPANPPLFVKAENADESGPVNANLRVLAGEVVVGHTGAWVSPLLLLDP